MDCGSNDLKEGSNMAVCCTSTALVIVRGIEVPITGTMTELSPPFDWAIGCGKCTVRSMDKHDKNCIWQEGQSKGRA